MKYMFFKALITKEAESLCQTDPLAYALFHSMVYQAIRERSLTIQISQSGYSGFSRQQIRTRIDLLKNIGFISVEKNNASKRLGTTIKIHDNVIADITDFLPTNKQPINEKKSTRLLTNNEELEISIMKAIPEDSNWLPTISSTNEISAAKKKATNKPLLHLYYTNRDYRIIYCGGGKPPIGHLRLDLNSILKIKGENKSDLLNIPKHQKIDTKEEASQSPALEVVQIVAREISVPQIASNEVKEKSKAKDDNKVLNERYIKFVNFVNTTFDRKLHPLDKYFGSFKARLKDYGEHAMIAVIKNLKAAPNHIESNYKYCTIEFVLRPDTFEKYKDMNAQRLKDQPKQSNKTQEPISNTTKKIYS